MLHDNLEGFMGELKALPKGSPDRGRFITAHMSHPPFLSAVQKHPEGKKIHSQLMGFLNSPANAGPAGAKVVVKSEAPATILKSEGDNSVAVKEYTVEEAASILRKDFHEKLVKYSAEIEKLIGRENLTKSVIPSHKHNQGAAASSGTEDIAAGQANPKGDFKAEKAEKCMKCGKMHSGKDLEKCGPITKSDLVDSKGKRSDNHTDPQSADMPDKSPAEPAKRDDSSGGKMTKSGGPSAMAKRAMSMNKSGDFKSKLKAAVDQNIKDYNGPAKPKEEKPKGGDSRLAPGPFYQGKPWQVSGEKKSEVTKAQPPMAKPPSGGAPGGSKTPPMSKPAAPPKMGAGPALGKDESSVMESKEKGLEKAGLGMAAHGQREAAAMGYPTAGGAPAPAAAKPVKLPGAPAQAARSAGFQDQMADVAAANKPAAAAKPALPKPAASGPAGAKLGLASPKAAGVTNAGPVQNAARPVAAKPGIFGKLFGKKQA